MQIPSAGHAIRRTDHALARDNQGVDGSKGVPKQQRRGLALLIGAVDEGEATITIEGNSLLLVRDGAPADPIRAV